MTLTLSDLYALTRIDRLRSADDLQVKPQSTSSVPGALVDVVADVKLNDDCWRHCRAYLN